MGDLVVVTGARGFVGPHVSRALRGAGFEVLAHGRSDGDLADAPPRWPGARHVVHLAGRIFVPDAWRDPAAFHRDNVLTTTNVLEYCRESGASLVHISSYVYGAPQRLPIDEQHPLQPFNPYAESKIAAERVVRDYETRFGVGATVIRPFNLYGPGQDGRFLIPTIVRQAIDPSLDAITVTDDRPRRDYVHVDDLAALVVSAIRAPQGGTFNAGSGESHSVAGIAERVGDLTGRRKPLRVTGPVRPNEILDVVADVSHAADELGWRPRVSFTDGLHDIVTSMGLARA